jgi:c-di-GMP-binding flagellar brake protein YcgR
MPQKRTTRRSERRRQPRADARLSMRLEGSVPEVEDRTQIVTESQNISASGVYCMASHYLAPTSKVALTIVLPRLPGSRGSKELIKCDGIVVRCDTIASRGREKHYELACSFSGLDDRRRMLIEEFVTWRNLQSLRTAIGAVNGTKRPARRTAARKSTRKSTAKRRTVH